MQMGGETSQREATWVGEKQSDSTISFKRELQWEEGSSCFLTCYSDSIVPRLLWSGWVSCERRLFGVQSLSHLALNTPPTPITPITCRPSIILMAQQHLSHLGPDYCSSLCAEARRFIKSLGFDLRTSPARITPTSLRRHLTPRLARRLYRLNLCSLAFSSCKWKSMKDVLDYSLKGKHKRDWSFYFGVLISVCLLLTRNVAPGWIIKANQNRCWCSRLMSLVAFNSGFLINAKGHLIIAMLLERTEKHKLQWQFQRQGAGLQKTLQFFLDKQQADWKSGRKQQRDVAVFLSRNKEKIIPQRRKKR